MAYYSLVCWLHSWWHWQNFSLSHFNVVITEHLVLSVNLGCSLVYFYLNIKYLLIFEIPSCYILLYSFLSRISSRKQKKQKQKKCEMSQQNVYHILLIPSFLLLHSLHPQNAQHFSHFQISLDFFILVDFFPFQTNISCCRCSVLNNSGIKNCFSNFFVSLYDRNIFRCVKTRQKEWKIIVQIFKFCWKYPKKTFQPENESEIWRIAFRILRTFYQNIITVSQA